MSTEARFEDEFLKFLQCLAEADCLKNIIIAGSWAEFLYEQCHVINPPYYADMKTYDTDFFVVTGERPNANKSLHEIAKENGFEPVHDYETGIVKYIGRDNFEVEFLSEQIGSPEEAQLFPMTSIGVRGTQLPHMWPMRMFNDNTMDNCIKIFRERFYNQSLGSMNNLELHYYLCNLYYLLGAGFFILHNSDD